MNLIERVRDLLAYGVGHDAIDAIDAFEAAAFRDRTYPAVRDVVEAATYVNDKFYGRTSDLTCDGELEAHEALGEALAAWEKAAKQAWGAE